MNQCIFDMAAIKPLVEHAHNSTEHRATYGMEVAYPGLLFVHDQGVYLMSNGKPGLFVEGDEPNQQVVYADGMSPDDEDWWEVSRAAVGGDDFAELLSLDVFHQAIEKGAERFVITVKPNTLEFSF